MFDTSLLANLELKLGSVIVNALSDPEVVEIMVNPDGNIWIERFGSMALSGNLPPLDARTVVSLVATSLNQVATAENALIEGELPLDGSRFEGVFQPVAAAPSFTIRKKAGRIFSLEEYLDCGIMPRIVFEAIIHAIGERKNILVVGGTGSGKTTLVNAIVQHLAVDCPNDRLVVIEDTPELQIASQNSVCLRTTPFITAQNLVRATMRLRPDRIIVGEVRDGTALDLLKSWNTGHPGGVATVHANSAVGGLQRMQDLISEVSMTPMHRLIGEAVDMTIFIRRAPGTGRRITQAAIVKEFDLATQTFITEYLHNEEKPSLALAS